MPTPPLNHSLARLLHEYGERWEIERVERSTEWVAVLRETAGNYIRIVGAHDIGALRYKMDEVERDKPEERETTNSP
ncbi:MAG: hypothetical protein ACLQDY_28195 [Streptosporangiaceae bacterium]